MNDNRAIKFFNNLGLKNRIRVMSESTASASEAAEVMKVNLGMIAKSLTFRTNDKPVLVVMSGDAKIHSKKFKDFFSVKSKMLDAEEVEEYTGYSIGGVCPFNLLTTKIDVYLDKSLQRYDVVYPGCGDSVTLIELKRDELEKYSNFIDWIDITKDY